VLELTATWARWSKVAALALLLVLCAAVLATYRSSGPQAALMLLAGVTTALLALGIVIARRRLRAEAARARLGERTLDAIPHAMFVVEALRRGNPNVYVNAAYSALTGYDAREAVGTGFDALSIFVDAADVTRFDGHEPGSKSARVNIRRRDGAIFPAKLELQPLPRGGDGRYVLGMLESVQAGERAADRKVGPQAASNSGHAKDAFLSWLNHELRSPLNACVMWLDVLALAPQADKLTQAVDAIKRNLARQTRLVNDLNDAAKVASGTLEVRSVPVDIVALLKRCLDAWQLLAIGKQITLDHRIEAEAASIDGDPDRLSQALNHVVENAISSTPTGGRVELRLGIADGHCIVEIEDGGAALSPEDAANLGTPLWRAATSAKARPGLGLGLAVAHHIAQRHGGSLVAASDSKGARFTLTLPLAAQGREVQSAPTNRTSSP